MKASNSDSEFEEIDDYIDDMEEFGGFSRAVKHSIRALNFNMVMHEEYSMVQSNRASLLSRASN